jgi:sugar-phosphatase
VIGVRTLSFTLPSEEEITCAAVLFDMDGVLIDSLDVVDRHLRRWASRHRLDPDRVVAQSPGLTNADLVRLVAPHLDAETETAALVAQDRDDLDGITAYPGAPDLLRSLPPSSWAVVTSAYRAVAYARLRHVGLPVPEVLVTAEDVTHGKPDPEGYRAAAKALGVSPHLCVVVEDAPSGIAAARAAGALPIGVTQGVPGSPLDTGLTVSSVSELRFEPAAASGARLPSANGNR